MSQPINKNEWSYGAGKGDYPRPVDRQKYRENFDQIDWSKHKNKSINESKKNPTDR
jgi:hypothetical protein